MEHICVLTMRKTEFSLTRALRCSPLIIATKVSMLSNTEQKCVGYETQHPHLQSHLYCQRFVCFVQGVEKCYCVTYCIYYWKTSLNLICRVCSQGVAKVWLLIKHMHAYFLFVKYDTHTVSHSCANEELVETYYLPATLSHFLLLFSFLLPPLSLSPSLLPSI